MFVRTLAGAFVVLALAAAPDASAQAPGSESAWPPSSTAISLVDPDWVSAHAEDASVRIVDLRPDPEAYLAGHVLNAAYLGAGALYGPASGLPLQLLPPELAATLLVRAGVTAERSVVLYSEGEEILDATLAAYVLEKLGHRDIRLLNGGWGGYRAGRVTQAYPRYSLGALPVRLNGQVGVTLDQLRGLLVKSGVVFVDARKEEDYRGDKPAWMRNGHLPGAVSLPWEELTDPDNPHKLKPPGELYAIVWGKGLRPAGDVVVYGATSREASLVYVVLKHVLGFPRVRVYEGSWAEYAGFPEMPVATGPTRGGGFVGGSGGTGE